MTDRIYKFLGLAMKAGKLLSGEETCERALKNEKVILMIISCDASENTKKKFSDACKYRDVGIRFFGEKELLGRYIGKEIRSAIAVLDNGFAERLTEMIDNLDEECGGGWIGKSKSI